MIPFMTLGGLGRGAGSAPPPAPDSDPYLVNVASLLHFNGADASTTFTDQTGRVWTAAGNAQIDTAQSKFGGASGLFDGSGDYLSTAATPDFYFGAGDFTIEFFARLTGSLPGAGSYRFLACRDNTASTRGWRLLVDGNVGGSLEFYDNVGATAYGVVDPSPMPLNTWVHVAIARVGNTLRLFRDGVIVDSETVTGLTFNDSNVAPLIGTGRTSSPVPGWSWNGHIDEFRVTKGVGRYSADFTVPASAYPDFGVDANYANVSSLLHFNGADASTTFTDQTGKTWSVAGNAQIDTAQSKFGWASGLFDGTGDRISAATSADFGFGSGDYTLEAWVRATNTSTRVNNIFDTRTAGNTGVAFFFGGGAFSVPANVIGFSSNSAVIATGGTVAANTWYHIALCRQGTTVRGFIDGVQVFSATDARTYASSSQCMIAADYAFTATQHLNGWVDEARITKGVARYTASFTPPAAPYPNG